MDPAPNQVGWVFAVGELYYGLNPIFLDDFRTKLVERPLINGSVIFFSALQSPEAQLYLIGAEQT